MGISLQELQFNGMFRGRMNRERNCQECFGIDGISFLLAFSFLLYGRMDQERWVLQNSCVSFQKR